MSVGDSRLFLQSGAAAAVSVRVDPVKHPWAQAPDQSQASLNAPPPFFSPLVHHVEEPIAHDGSAWILRRFAVLPLGSTTSAAA